MPVYDPWLTSRADYLGEGASWLMVAVFVAEDPSSGFTEDSVDHQITKDCCSQILIGIKVNLKVSCYICLAPKPMDSLRIECCRNTGGSVRVWFDHHVQNQVDYCH